MERVIFDTDLYIDWLREGAREELMVEASLGCDTKDLQEAKVLLTELSH